VSFIKSPNWFNRLSRAPSYLEGSPVIKSLAKLFSKFINIGSPPTSPRPSNPGNGGGVAPVEDGCYEAP
jgi:hypothetical protein